MDINIEYKYWKYGKQKKGRGWKQEKEEKKGNGIKKKKGC